MPVEKKYRLEPLLKLKERVKKKSQLDLAKAIRDLEEEREKLKALESKREEIQQKREKARAEMNKKVSTGQSRIKESQFHMDYMTKLQEDEEALDSEIADQKEAVSLSEEKLKRARRDYVDAATECNVMEKHKDLWRKKQSQALSVLENKQMNELANSVYQINKMRAM